MDEVTTFMKAINDYFQSENLGAKFMTILSRMKKIDASTMIQKKNNSIIVYSKKREVFRVDKRYDGYGIKIKGSIYDYISFDDKHMSTICRSLKIPDKGLEVSDEKLEKSSSNSKIEFKKYSGGDSIFKKQTDSTSAQKPNEVTQKNIDINSDITIKCADCGRAFIFTKGEAEYYNKNGWTMPRRCKDCRERKKNTEKDYYDIGLKKNTSQHNLDTWGMIAEFNGPAESEGYTSLY